jgi:hypothetical protein
MLPYGVLGLSPFLLVIPFAIAASTSKRRPPAAVSVAARSS